LLYPDWKKTGKIAFFNLAFLETFWQDKLMQFPFNLANNRKFDVIGFGTNAVDFLIQVPFYPEFDSKIELSEYTQSAGGEVATTVVGLQRLGLKTAYAGRFGTDEAGNYGLQTLIDEGVNTDFAEQIEGARTQIAFIIIDERNGERTIIWKRDKQLSFDETEVSDEIATLGRVLHFTPHDTRACIKLAKIARENSTIVSIDIDKNFPGTEELLHFVDILICSAEFAEDFIGIKDKKEALKELHSRYGSKVVGMTLGETGSLMLCENEFIETEGFEVPGGCKDTTGAGDSFRTGFLYGLLRGETVEQSAKMANAVAALKCRKIGARTALPKVDELTNLLSE
jgi:sugar/nucleoside kinase (ribokinase family)